MSQVIQIKRTAGAVGNKTLHQGELAYSQADDKLYIGNDMANANAHAPVAIGGVAFTDMLTPAVETSSPAGLVLGDQQAAQETITISSPASVTSSYSLTLPAADGTEDQVLSTDGSGQLGWATSTSSIEDASDTTIASAANGNILVYNETGTTWNNLAVSGDATIANTGALSISNDGKQAVKDFIESGDLNIQGTVTSINSTAVAISDKTLVLGSAGGMTEGLSSVSSNVAEISGLTGFTGVAGESVYVEKSGNIPAGVYTILAAPAPNASGFSFNVEVADQTEVAVAVTKDKVTDALASGGGLVIPGGTGLKTLTFDSTDNAFVSNQSLGINQDEPGTGETVNSLLTIEGMEFGKVTKTEDSGTVTTTATLGAAGIGWGGDTIGLDKGGTGLTTLAKGSIFYGSDTNVVGELTSASASLTGTQSGLLSLAADNTLSWTTTVDGGSW